MNGLIQLLILYLVFMAIGSLVKKSKSTGGSQLKGKKPGQQDLQATFEGYLAKIEDYFSEKKPSELSAQQVLRQSERSVIPPTEPQRFERSSAQTSPQERPLSELQLTFPAESETRKKLKAAKFVQKIPHRSSSLLPFNKRRGYLQGMILSEILGPPVSKRRRKRA